MIAQMLEHARECAPQESCGLIVGIDENANRGEPKYVQAVRVVCMTNAEPDDKTVRYLIDAREHFDTVRSAEAEGLAIVGAFHSHVKSPAEPSKTDVNLAAYPEWAWLIISLMETRPDLKAFVITSGSYKEIEIRVE